MYRILNLKRAIYLFIFIAYGKWFSIKWKCGPEYGQKYWNSMLPGGDREK